MSPPAQFPHIVYAPEVEEWVTTTYDHQWVLRNFDWMDWLEEHGAQEVTPERIRTATVEDLERLITAMVRQERFAEGALSLAFEQGVILAIVRRAAELARQQA